MTETLTLINMKTKTGSKIVLDGSEQDLGLKNKVGMGIEILRVGSCCRNEVNFQDEFSYRAEVMGQYICETEGNWR